MDYWSVSLLFGILYFQRFCSTGGRKETGLFTNHRRNRILLMKNEVSNLVGETHEPVESDANDVDAPYGRANERYERSISKIKEKAIRAKIRKHHLFKKRSQHLNAEIQKRKLTTTTTTTANSTTTTANSTTKEIIPSVAFSHNGTYNNGATSKIVQDANITYKNSPLQGKSRQNRYVKKKPKRKEVCKKEMFRIPLESNGKRKFIVVPSC